MNRYMGIDGGGSTLRVAVIDHAANVLVEVTEGTANPNLIGRDAATQHIQSAMQAALAPVGDVAGVGIGIAGASAEYAEDWLLSVVRGVLPSVHVAAASDNEIALVGATGKREGLLILSGTGSGVFGINPQGEKLQVGGWGYLLGDEGSGYWLGLQAIRYATRCYDRGLSTPFYEAVLTELGTNNGRGIIQAVYLNEKPVPTVARLAPTVLAFAEQDADARAIVQQAVDDLAQQASIAMQRLKMPEPTIAFAGSILQHENPVSQGLAAALNLPQIPQALYRPVIGAALLAQFSLKDARS